MIDHVRYSETLSFIFKSFKNTTLPYAGLYLQYEIAGKSII